MIFLLIDFDVDFVTACGKADIGLVLDASGSVSQTNWDNAMMPFIEDLARKLPVAADGVHFGAVTYSRTCKSTLKNLRTENKRAN